MAQISEFSLILGALGVSLGHIDQETMGLITFVGLVTIGLSTYLILYSGPIYERLAPMLGVFERRTPYREIAAGAQGETPRADVILFGLGRYGSGIAQHLRRRHRRVLGVDFDPAVLDRWRASGLSVLYGDAEDPELFEHLPLAHARWVVHATPTLDTGRMLLRHLQDHRFSGKVAVTCRTAEEAEILSRAGADLVLRPFVDAAEQAADALTSAMDQLVAAAPDAIGLREVRLTSGSPWAGHAIADIPLREQFGVTVLAVSRSGRSMLNPEPAFQLFPNDRLILSGDPGDLTRAAEYLSRRGVPRRRAAGVRSGGVGAVRDPRVAWPFAGGARSPESVRRDRDWLAPNRRCALDPRRPGPARPRRPRGRGGTPRGSGARPRGHCLTPVVAFLTAMYPRRDRTR